MYEEQEPITVGDHVVVRVATSTNDEGLSPDYVTFMVGCALTNGMCLSLDMTRQEAESLGKALVLASVAGLPLDARLARPEAV